MLPRASRYHGSHNTEALAIDSDESGNIKFDDVAEALASLLVADQVTWFL